MSHYTGKLAFNTAHIRVCYRQQHLRSPYQLKPTFTSNDESTVNHSMLFKFILMA